jgi:hypothetical protein
MKTFEAIYMPGGEGMNKGGFKLEQEAWDYIISRNCDNCKEEGIHSMCSAEWEVEEEIEPNWESLRGKGLDNKLTKW